MNEENIKNSRDEKTEKEEKESIGIKLLDELKNWNEDFTMHGFKNIMKEKNIMNITTILSIFVMSFSDNTFHTGVANSRYGLI
jgi:hypothetical protein